MLEKKLIESFEEQSNVIARRLAAVRVSLAREEDEEESLRLRYQATRLENFAATVKRALTTVMSAAGEIEQAESKFAKWRAAFRKCVELQAQFESLETQRIRAQGCVEVAENRFLAANAAAQEFEPLDDLYATEPRKRQHNQEREQLQTAARGYQQKMFEAKAQLATIEGQWSDCRRKLADCSNQERWLRPLEPQQQRRVFTAGTVA